MDELLTATEMMSRRPVCGPFQNELNQDEMMRFRGGFLWGRLSCSCLVEFPKLG